MREIVRLMILGESCEKQIANIQERMEATSKVNVILTNDNHKLTTDYRALSERLNTLDEQNHRLKRNRFIWLGTGIIGGVILYGIIQ